MEDLIPDYNRNASYEVPSFPEESDFSDKKELAKKVEAAVRLIKKDQQKFIKRVDQRLINKSFVCNKCDRTFHPEWTKFHWPYKVITILEREQEDPKYIAIPTGAEITCPICKNQTNINYPKYREPKSSFIIFHDEAYRGEGNKHLLFSGVAVSKEYIEELSILVSEYKDSIGVKETLHMKNIWHEKITSDPEFLTKTENFCKKIANSKAIQIFCTLHKQTSTPPNGKSARREHRRTRFMKAAIMLLQQEITVIVGETKCQPVFVFDRDNENTLWLSQAIGALMCTLMFPFMTNLIKVPITNTIRGGSNAGSELADFICYIMARYIDGKTDVDHRWLGRIYYIVKRESDKSVVATQKNNFPLHLYPLD